MAGGLHLTCRLLERGDDVADVVETFAAFLEPVGMGTPDGHGRIELSRSLAPRVVADHRNAPVNALGYLRVMFAVDDLDDTLARLRTHGAQLVDEVVRYENAYRLCYDEAPWPQSVEMQRGWVGGRRPPHVEYREWPTVVVEWRATDDYEAERLVEAARGGILLVDVDRQVAVA